LLIFCISQGSVVTHLRCVGKHGTNLIANLITAESDSEGIFKIDQHFSKLWTNIGWHRGTFLWLSAVYSDQLLSEGFAENIVTKDVLFGEIRW